MRGGGWKGRKVSKRGEGGLENREGVSRAGWAVPDIWFGKWKKVPLFEKMTFAGRSTNYFFSWGRG
jgi:hypothetical protein